MATHGHGGAAERVWTNEMAALLKEFWHTQKLVKIVRGVLKSNLRLINIVDQKIINDGSG